MIRYDTNNRARVQLCVGEKKNFSLDYRTFLVITRRMKKSAESYSSFNFQSLRKSYVSESIRDLMENVAAQSPDTFRFSMCQ